MGPYPTKVMDHAAYQKSLRRKTVAELVFIRNDALAAAEAGEGWNPNEGYYRDEAAYCGMELKRRREEIRAPQGSAKKALLAAARKHGFGRRD